MYYSTSGYSEPTRNDSITVGTTAIEASPQKGRKVIYLKNSSTSSTAVITVAMSPSLAVAGSGVLLAQGEFIVDSDTGNYQCWQGVITAVSNEAGATLAIFER